MFKVQNQPVRQNRHMNTYVIQKRTQTSEKTAHRRLQSAKGQRQRKFKQIQFQIQKSRLQWQKTLQKYQKDLNPVFQSTLNRSRRGFQPSKDYLRDPYLQQGLPNMGNTCFLNAMIQCLYAVQRFRAQVIRKSGSINNGYYCYLLGTIFRMIQYNTKYSVKRQMLNICMNQLQFIDSSYVKRTQQDSRSFLFNFLHLIGQQNPGIISMNFTLGYEQRCQYCSECISIQQDYFVKQKQVNCFSCKKRAKIVFLNTPTYLIILKETQTLKQIQQFQVQQNKKAIYHAISNCVYIGSGFSGHYYAHRYIKEGQWGEFNDSVVAKKYKKQTFYKSSVLFAIYEFKEIKDNQESYNPQQKFNLTKTNQQIIYRKKNTNLQFKPKQIYHDCVKGFYKKDKKGQIQTQNIIVKYKVQEQANKFLVQIINTAILFYVKKNIFILEKSNTKQQFLNDLQKELMKNAQRCFEQIGPKQFARQTFKSNQPKDIQTKRPSSPKKGEVLGKNSNLYQISKPSLISTFKKSPSSQIVNQDLNKSNTQKNKHQSQIKNDINKQSPQNNRGSDKYKVSSQQYVTRVMKLKVQPPSKQQLSTDINNTSTQKNEHMRMNAVNYKNRMGPDFTNKFYGV